MELRRVDEVREQDLTDDQRAALALLRTGRNVFLDGMGGTGKSALINLYIRELCERGTSVLACAPTGIAALNLGGSTMHRAFGLPYKVVYDYRKMPRKPTKAISAADVVIVDEVSMARCDLFDTCMNKIAEEMVGRLSQGRPMQQVIVVGDFFQLPPVVRDSDAEMLRVVYGSDFEEGYAFEGMTWDPLGFERAPLRQVVRQSDAEHVSMLARARLGDVSCLPYFNSRVGAEADPGTTRLFGRNAAVNAYNARAIAGIDEPEHAFDAAEIGQVNQGDKSTDDHLVLKRGARVMAVANDQLDRFRNGSTGTVCGFDVTDAGECPVVLFDGTSSPVQVAPFTWEVMKPFASRDPQTGRMTVEQEVIGSWTQVPLRVAYAMTIHKAQGQTLDAAVIDPASFSAGQLYVALSRVRSLDGMSLRRPIQPADLITSRSVTNFYDESGF